MPSLGTATLTEDQIEDLFYAARAGELEEFVTYLSEIRTALSLGDNRTIYASAIDSFTGNTVLHYASANGHTGILKHVLSDEGIKVDDRPQLNQSLVNHQNQSGNSPLHYAAVNGQLEAAKLLVESVEEAALGDILSLKNQAGYDAAFEAENANHSEVASFLNQHMNDGGAGGDSKEQEGVPPPDEAAEDAGTNGQGAENATEKVANLNISLDQTG